MNREEIIFTIKSYFADKLVKSGYLFSSFARSQELYSDVDVLVGFERGVTLISYARIIDDLAKLVGTKVDVIPNSGLSKRVEPYVVKDKLLNI